MLVGDGLGCFLRVINAMLAFILVCTLGLQVEWYSILTVRFMMRGLQGSLRWRDEY